MVFLQTQVRSGHSLCLSRVGSSVPRTRPPPRVAQKDPRLSVPDCSSLSLRPSLPSLWYPVHTHVPTTGLWTGCFPPPGLCTCQCPHPGRLFHPLCAQFVPHHRSAISSKFSSSDKPSLTSQQSNLLLQAFRAPGTFLQSTYPNYIFTL